MSKVGFAGCGGKAVAMDSASVASVSACHGPHDMGGRIRTAAMKVHLGDVALKLESVDQTHQ